MQSAHPLQRPRSRGTPRPLLRRFTSAALLLLLATPACYEEPMPDNPEVVWLKENPPAVPEGEFCVVSDEPSKKGFTVQYKGKPYYLCCKKCVRSFVAEPERYASGEPIPHQSE